MPFKVTNYQILLDLLESIPNDDSCIEWTRGRNEKGYGEVRHQGIPRLAHRAAYHVAIGPIPEDMGVLHKCDNPPCVRPSHLFTGTHLENMQDCARKNRAISPYGEHHHFAKVTSQQVLEIRSLRLAGYILKDLAKRYGITIAAAHHIITRKTWRHI